MPIICYVEIYVLNIVLNIHQRNLMLNTYMPGILLNVCVESLKDYIVNIMVAASKQFHFFYVSAAAPDGKPLLFIGYLYIS